VTKVVLDTNVLISGIYFRGLPGKILEAWGTRHFQLLASTEILQEYMSQNGWQIDMPVLNTRVSSA